MMKRTVLQAATAAVLAIPAALSAQSGGFVARLGNDTLGVERYSRTADKIEGTIVTKSPATRVTTYTLSLAKDGTITGLEQSVLKADGTPFPGQPTGTKMTFVGDMLMMHWDTGGYGVKIKAM